MRKLRPCLVCNTPTRNPKFCSRTCSATYNNVIYPKRVKVLHYCKNCGAEVLTRGNYCNAECLASYRNKQIGADLILGDKKHRPDTLKRFIRELKGNKCEICSLKPIWNGKPLVLVLDHINGNSEDNTPENLRLVCSNCNSQLDTFAGRNKKGTGRFYRRKRYQEGLSY